MSDAPAVAALPAVPRSTGEIITDAVDALRRSFLVAFSFCVPFCAVDLLLREVAQHLLLRVSAQLADAGSPDWGLLQTLASSFLAAVGAGLGSFVVQQLLSTGVMGLGERLAAGQPVSVADAVRRAVDRGAAVVLTGVLFLLGALFVPAVTAAVPIGAGVVVALAVEQPLLVLPAAILGALLALIAVIVVTLRWSLYAAVVVTEGLAGFAALRRSAALTAPRGLPFGETPRFRLSVLFLIGLALASTLQSLFLVPRLAIAALTGWSFADGALPGLAALPVWFMVPFGLLEVATNAAVLPFSAFLLCFFALDLRVRYEGYDLGRTPPPAA
jgi:hypothetical protein